MTQAYHKPVMLEECIEALSVKPNGTYVDVTFGGGGHSRAILQELGDSGRLIAFDQDTDAAANSPGDDRFSLVQANFEHLARFMKLKQINGVNGILADLGVSSHQIDTAERGFSTRFDGPLDMRMNPASGRTAETVLQSYSADRLQDMFSQYGEMRNAKSLAHAIVDARTSEPLETTSHFVALLRKLCIGKPEKYFAQAFQAIRIEVNRELETLKALLQQSLEMLTDGGRLVIMSYHSLEDRLVKNFMKHGNFSNEADKDEFGNIYRPFKIITKKPQMATDAEIARNPRARSARLRIAEKRGHHG